MARPLNPNLTDRQREVFEWIKDFAREHSMPPTVREIARAFGIQTSSVFDTLKYIEKKGYLKRGNLGARSLIIQDGDTHAHCGCTEVPVIGHIAAGKPIFAEEDRTGTVTVDGGVTRGRETYALRVEGDSMVEAGILDGDVVIIRRQDTADDGDIVVALIEDEATLKRFHREKNRIRLEPANRRMKPIYVSSGEFRIQGKVVALKRLLS